MAPITIPADSSTDIFVTHDERMRDHRRTMRKLRHEKAVIDKEMRNLEREAIYREADLRAEMYPLQPYADVDDMELEDDWVDYVTDREELLLYISPTDVLVNVLNTAFKPWYVHSVSYTVDPTMQSLTLDVRFGGLFFYLLLMTNPYLALLIPYILRGRLDQCDLMPEVTHLDTVNVDFSWVAPAFSGIEEVHDREDLVQMTMNEDFRLKDSYLNRQVRLLPDLSDEEE